MTTIATPRTDYRPALAAINDLRALITAEIAAEHRRMEVWRTTCSPPSE